MIKIKQVWVKRLIILAISTIIILLINPPIKHYKVNEKFYKEHGIEYNIVKCPECNRDVADVQQFCLNCGAVLFDADEQTLEALDKIRESLKPTPQEKAKNVLIKLSGYIFAILVVYLIIDQLLEWIQKHIQKKKGNKKEK